jgi:hypothetical protein
MAERAEHAELVADLEELVEHAGFVVTQVDAPGRPRPSSYSHCRPDLFAEHVVVRFKMIGEAKIDADALFASQSLNQFAIFSRVLIPSARPKYAHFVLAVPSSCVDLAWRALALAGVSGSNVTVAGRAEDAWLITSHLPREAASWRGYALRTRPPSSRFAVASTPRGSGAGAAMYPSFQVSPILHSPAGG